MSLLLTAVSSSFRNCSAEVGSFEARPVCPKSLFVTINKSRTRIRRFSFIVQFYEKCFRSFIGDIFVEPNPNRIKLLAECHRAAGHHLQTATILMVGRARSPHRAVFHCGAFGEIALPFADGHLRPPHRLRTPPHGHFHLPHRHPTAPHDRFTAPQRESDASASVFSCSALASSCSASGLLPSARGLFRRIRALDSRANRPLPRRTLSVSQPEEHVSTARRFSK